MKSAEIQFRFLDNTYLGQVDYFDPPTVMPYYKVTISDPALIEQFGMIHNFKEQIVNGFPVLTPAIDPQSKFHPYFWTCLLAEIYIFLLNEIAEVEPTSITDADVR